MRALRTQINLSRRRVQSLKMEEESSKATSILVRLRQRDDWETPLEVWRQIAQFLPPKSRIWQPFYYNGSCKAYMEQLGHQVVHEDRDFFSSHPPPDSILCDNTPFSQKKAILEHLVTQRDIPFILIVPIGTLATSYFHALVEQTTSQAFKAIIPKRRMQFSNTRSSPPFACVWLAYKCPFLAPPSKQLLFI